MRRKRSTTLKSTFFWPRPVVRPCMFSNTNLWENGRFCVSRYSRIRWRASLWGDFRCVHFPKEPSASVAFFTFLAGVFPILLVKESNNWTGESAGKTPTTSGFPEKPIVLAQHRLFSCRFCTFWFSQSCRFHSRHSHISSSSNPHVVAGCSRRQGHALIQSSPKRCVPGFFEAVMKKSTSRMSFFDLRHQNLLRTKKSPSVDHSPVSLRPLLPPFLLTMGNSTGKLSKSDLDMLSSTSEATGFLLLPHRLHAPLPLTNPVHTQAPFLFLSIFHRAICIRNAIPPLRPFTRSTTAHCCFSEPFPPLFLRTFPFGLSSSITNFPQYGPQGIA